MLITQEMLVKGTVPKSCVHAVLAQDVRFIPDRALQNYKELRTIRFPPSLQDIGEGAFSCCDGLVSVVLPPSVKTIGDLAFFSCKSLHKVRLWSRTKEGWRVFPSWTDVEPYGY